MVYVVVYVLSALAVYNLLCTKKVGRVLINKTERKNTMREPEFRISKVIEEKFPRRHTQRKNGKEKVSKKLRINHQMRCSNRVSSSIPVSLLVCP